MLDVGKPLIQNSDLKPIHREDALFGLETQMETL